MSDRFKNILVAHRPRRFSELLGNKRIKREFAEMLRRQAIPAGFLLTGPAGCGKTTLAYLLIRRLRCQTSRPDQLEPCLECHGCVAVDLHTDSPFQGEGVFVINCAKLTSASLGELLGHVHLAYPCLTFYFDEAQRTAEPLQDKLVTFLEAPTPNSVVIMSLINDDDIEEPLKQRLHNFALAPPPDAELRKLLRNVWQAEGGEELSDGLLDRLIVDAGGVPRKCLNALRHCLFGNVSSLEAYIGAQHDE